MIKGSLESLDRGMSASGTCAICHGYIHDYMNRPMRPDDLLFKIVHHKRLQKVIPDFIEIFERFFGRLSEFEFSVAACMIDTDAIASLEKDENALRILAYKSMAKWFKMLDNDYGLAKMLIYENCITKKANELIGFWLSELFVIKEIHMEHSRKVTMFIEVEEDELYR
jgi:hypothetical protein